MEQNDRPEPTLPASAAPSPHEEVSITLDGMMDVEFNLQAPAHMSPGQYRRAVAFARAAVNMADADNNGYLSAEESLGIGQTAVKAQRTVEAQRQKIMAQNVQNMLNNPLLPKKENAPDATAMPQSPQPLPLMRPRLYSHATIEDAALYNPTIARDELAAGYAISKEDAARVLARTVPKGVEEVKVSDFCQAQPDLNCTPTPLGEVRVYTQKGNAL